jgi:hypothetical protein
VMWIAACGISTVMFIVELLRVRLEKFVRACFGLFYFIKFLKTRFAQLSH